MNLAVIIGVSKYVRPGCDLPACDNDVKAVRALLDATGKYDDILEVSGEVNSTSLKGKLSQFIKKHKNPEVKIDELLFYFTGHGGLFSEKFYFLLTDFEQKRAETTSLSNEELDAMLRSLSPQLAIKIVDSCHAGTAYVKDPDLLQKTLDTSKCQFNICYFMFSSQSNQSSYQDQRLSAFTEALLDACATFEGNDIRYKDIVDRVSDSFSENPEQRPLFVIQANLTEDFCSFEEEQKKTLIQTIEKYKQPHNQGSPTENPPVPGKPGSAANLSLLEIAKAQSADYCTKEEVGCLQFLLKLG